MIELLLSISGLIIIATPIYLARRQNEKDKQREAEDYLALVEFLRSEQLKDDKYLKALDKYKDMPMKDKNGWTNIYRIDD